MPQKPTQPPTTGRVYPDNITRIDDIAAVVPTTRPDDSHDRITANLQFYFEQIGEEPVGFESRFSGVVPHTDEEPWQRKFKAGPEWEPLKLGYLEGENVGVVIIENRAGMGLQTKPTEEERESIQKQVMRVAYDASSPGFLIRPGRFMFVEPADAAKLIIRSEHGTTKGRLLVVPTV